MTDAKDVRETLRERARPARVRLMDAHPTMSYAEATVVALLNVATEQIDILTRERDALKTQLAAARGAVAKWWVDGENDVLIGTVLYNMNGDESDLTAAITQEDA